MSTTSNNSQENRDAQTRQRQTKDQAESPPKQVTPRAAELKSPVAQDQCHKSCKKTKHWLDYATFVIELLGLLGLGIYAWLTYGIYCANNKSADAAKSSADTAKDTLVVSNRAWVEPRIAPPYDAVTNGSYGKFLPKLPVLDFLMTLTNVGKLPVRGLIVFTGVEVPKNSESPVFDYGGMATRTQVTVLYPNRSNIVHAEKYTAGSKPSDPNNTAELISANLREELEHGDRYIAVYAQGVFYDGLGQYWFQYCLWMQFMQGSAAAKRFNAEKCTAYNNWGDGTPAWLASLTQGVASH